MTWLLFLDESGHDHKALPYEVRGGVALHVSKLWAFVRSVQKLEYSSFGIELSTIKKEIKGCKLLDKDRLAWASQGQPFEDEQRRKHCRSFLDRGNDAKMPIRDEFTAYGQACLEMARGMFQLMLDHSAVIFAAAIPRGVAPPKTFEAADYLRKDQVFLLERFFYFLESKQDHGLIVMDETEKSNDRRFVRRLHQYFLKTATGRYRTAWIVPTPLFVSSDMTSGVQAADLCCYAINRGFRLPAIGMNAETRPQIEAEFGPWLRKLQFECDVVKDGIKFHTRGITYVPDPYEPRGKKKEAMPSRPPLRAGLSRASEANDSKLVD